MTRMRWPKDFNWVHPSHKTRISDSSWYDEKCTICGATDFDDSLKYPCTGK